MEGKRTKDDTFHSLDQIFHSLGETRGHLFSEVLDREQFHLNEMPAPAEPLPHVFAGGNVIYTVPSGFLADRHDCYTMLVCTDGSARLALSSREFVLHRQSFLFLAPGQDYRCQTLTTPFCFHLLLAGGTTLPSYLALLNGSADKPYYFRDECSDAVASSFIQIHQYLKTSAPRSDLMISKGILDIVCDLAHSDCTDIDTSSFPAHIRQLKVILDEEYPSPHTLDSLQDRIGINKYRLCRDFSQCMGTSPFQYLSQVRIEHSIRLLLETDLTIHAVGDNVGIPNTTHFIKLFRRQTGFTPLQYRRMQGR